MTYKELPIGQKIEINEREFSDKTGRTHIVRKQYTVLAKYSCMCIVENKRGSRKGLSLGDLITNGIIEQKAELEELRKEVLPKSLRKKDENEVN